MNQEIQAHAQFGGGLSGQHGAAAIGALDFGVWLLVVSSSEPAVDTRARGRKGAREEQDALDVVSVL